VAYLCELTGAVMAVTWNDTFLWVL
jgi:hypothetical protein